MNNTALPKMYELIKNIVSEDIENYSVSVQEPNKKGDGYLGKMTFISIRNKNTGKLLNLVIKEAHAEELIRRSTPVRNVFLNEIYFYTKVWPRFQNFEKDLKLKKKFDKIPKCFTTVSDNTSEKIVLENVKLQNFEMFPKAKTFNKDHVEYIFTQYGKFHALSFAYRELDPESYFDLTKGLIDIYTELAENEFFTKALKLSFEICLNSLQPGKDDSVLEKYKPYVENGVKIFFNCNNYAGPYSAILHGDCWSNNMMFKYDEFKKVIDMRLLDFQLAKDGTPVIDLSYCFYSGASKDLLDDLDYFLKIYHNSLSDTLSELGYNADELYPFKELKKDWKNHCQLGFGMGLFLWKIKSTYDEDVVDFTDFTENIGASVKELFDAKYDETTFKERTRDLILHMYENDFL